MAMQKKFDLVFSGEKYKNSAGEEKTRFINVGAVFERDDGTLCAKIETLPIGFTGWLNLFEPRDSEQQATQRHSNGRGGSSTQQRHSAAAHGGGADAMDDDDIPFRQYQHRVLW